MATAHSDTITTAPTRPRRTARAIALRLVRSAAFIYIAVSISMWFLQNKLVFPGASSQGQKTAMVLRSTLYELIELKTRDGDKTFAVFARAMDSNRQPLPESAAAACPTAIFFYGNGDCLANALGYVRYFRELGVNVLAVEYVGYGMADGKPSEKSFYATADAAYDYAITRRDVDKSKIVPIGVSIGAGPAIDLAVRRPTAGVVCFSPFTSLKAMAREVIPWLPTSLLLSYTFDNKTKLATYPRPIFITHGRVDQVIPFRMSEALQAAAKGPVTFVPIDHADHNDLLEAGYNEITPGLRTFFASLVRND